jgi:heme-degrading monooxygenase HmoA
MPYVRVTVLSYDPAKQEAIERFANEQFDTKLRQLPGFRRWTSAGDRAGHGVTISEWDTLEQAQAGALPALGLAQSLADLGVQQEALYVYEVVTQI